MSNNESGLIKIPKRKNQKNCREYLFQQSPWVNPNNRNYKYLLIQTPIKPVEFWINRSYWLNEDVNPTRYDEWLEITVRGVDAKGNKISITGTGGISQKKNAGFWRKLRRLYRAQIDHIPIGGHHTIRLPINRPIWIRGDNFIDIGDSGSRDFKERYDASPESHHIFWFDNKPLCKK